ncbi:hypothetical protein [Echinicola shivajiensis]|uniref:hypothetical protein n=1 Tax=Echinicola shivajiensis TaxID=1035916 RepID=UPI001FE3FE35|nr:hypothetical protein [Echinicola shivajiensis]
MENKRNQRTLVQKRISVLLVALCCFLISNSHLFIPTHDQQSCEVKMQQQSDSDQDNQKHQTFLDVASDAVVVPFASMVAQSTMHLIYEIVGFEEQEFVPQAYMAKYPSHFLEVLLERIISPNAP